MGDVTDGGWMQEPENAAQYCGRVTSQTEAATVAELKNLLADPACRIKLHDFISDETTRTVNDVVDAQCEGHDECLQAYESASAGLLKLLVTGSYFSNSADHDRAWAHAIRLLANRMPYTNSAHESVINLAHHVTLLAIYAVAFGAAAADRIDPIARIIGTVRAEEDDRPGRITYLVNCDRLKKPDEAPIQASHRLWVVLRSVTEEFIPSTQEDAVFDSVLDEVEYLIGVTHGRTTAEGNGPVGFGAIQMQLPRTPPDRLVRRHLDTLIAHGAFESVEQFYLCRDRYNKAYAEAAPS